MNLRDFGSLAAELVRRLYCRTPFCSGSNTTAAAFFPILTPNSLRGSLYASYQARNMALLFKKGLQSLRPVPIMTQMTFPDWRMP